MKVLCNLTTKKLEKFSRWDDIEFNSETHIVLTVTSVPNMDLDRLNATNDGIDVASQAVIDEIKRIQALQTARDTLLEAVVYDFGDGRIIHARESDETKLRVAITDMIAKSETTIDWVGTNSYKAAYTLTEIQTANTYGIAENKRIWLEYDPNPV